MSAQVWTERDSNEFEGFCNQATDRQLHGILEKERERQRCGGVGANECVRIVKRELRARGIIEVG